MLVREFSTRFYRVQLWARCCPIWEQEPIPSSWPAKGFNAIQYAPSGKLGSSFGGTGPRLPRRNGTVWEERVIGRFGNTYVPGAREEYRFQPHVALLFDSQSRAHVLRLSGSSVRHHIEQGDGSFAEDTAISLSSVGSSFSLFSAAIGPGDKLHIAVDRIGENHAYQLGSNKSGAWQWSRVTNVTGDPRGFFNSLCARWFSMAIDSRTART